jgi:hypothetical protein
MMKRRGADREQSGDRLPLDGRGLCEARAHERLLQELFTLESAGLG